MKKLLTLATTIVLVGTVSAQMSAGAKAGLTYSSYGTKIDPEPTEKVDAESGIGFHLGGYLTYMFSDKIGLRPELLYDSRGIKSTETSSTTTDLFGTVTTTKTETESKGSLSYLEVPILLNFQLSDALSLQAGPALGFLMSAKSKFDSTTTTTVTDGGDTTTSTASVSGDDSSTEGLRGMELGLCVGGIFETEGGLNFGVRYWRGLSTLNEETDFGTTTVKTNANVIQVSVGYSFIKE